MSKKNYHGANQPQLVRMCEEKDQEIENLKDQYESAAVAAEFYKKEWAKAQELLKMAQDRHPIDRLRFEAAKAALSGYLSNGVYDDVASRSIEKADALLKALGEPAKDQPLPDPYKVVFGIDSEGGQPRDLGPPINAISEAMTCALEEMSDRVDLLLEGNKDMGQELANWFDRFRVIHKQLHLDYPLPERKPEAVVLSLAKDFENGGILSPEAVVLGPLRELVDRFMDNKNEAIKLSNNPPTGKTQNWYWGNSYAWAESHRGLASALDTLPKGYSLTPEREDALRQILAREDPAKLIYAVSTISMSFPEIRGLDAIRIAEEWARDTGHEWEKGYSRERVLFAMDQVRAFYEACGAWPDNTILLDQDDPKKAERVYSREEVHEIIEYYEGLPQPVQKEADIVDLWLQSREQEGGKNG